MRHQTASIRESASRFVRIFVAAAACAAAVALLALLPAFGQSTFDRTDGETGSGSGLSIGVFADIEDAQLEKNRETTYRNPRTNETTTVYVPIENPNAYLGTRGSHRKITDTAYLANGRVSPQHTFFDGTLFVSNDPEGVQHAAHHGGERQHRGPGGRLCRCRGAQRARRRHDHGADTSVDINRTTRRDAELLPGVRARPGLARGEG